MSTGRDAPAPRNELESLIAVAEARIEIAPASADAAASGKGRVLLVEDDAELRTIICDYLIGNGYTVVAVSNGGDGVRETLSGDFAFVVCDLMMSGLPGDMFFRAIERIRPELCPRFVFITGYGADAHATQFLKKIDGLMLQKPFPLKALLDALAIAEVRGSFQSVFDGHPADPALSQTGGPGAEFPAAIPPSEESEIDAKIARIVARVRTAPPPGGPSGAFPATEPEACPSRMSRSFGFPELALVLVLVAGLWKPYWGARDRVDAASAQLLALEAEYTAVSRNLHEAIAERSKIEAAQRQLAEISADRAEPRWAPALRSIVACAGSGIQVREVRAREKLGDGKTWTLLVGGVATGAAPRTVADHFRRSLERELEQQFLGGVSIRLEQFEDLPALPSTLPGDRRGRFTIIATIGIAEKTRAESKKGA